MRVRKFSVCLVSKPKAVLAKKTSDTTNDTISPWEQYQEEDLIFWYYPLFSYFGVEQSSIW
jgi:hypothetical protein